MKVLKTISLMLILSVIVNASVVDKEYMELINLKASLIPVQVEINSADKEHPLNQSLASLYDKAANAWNLANDSWKDYQLASKLGLNTHKTHTTFKKYLNLTEESTFNLNNFRGVRN